MPLLISTTAFILCHYFNSVFSQTILTISLIARSYSRHTKQPIEKVYADKGYAGKPNREFLALNNIADGIMRKDTTTAKLTEYEKERNKKISKVRYIVEQYFGLSHLHDGAKRARFTNIIKNKFDCWYRQSAYNISRGLKILGAATI